MLAELGLTGGIAILMTGQEKRAGERECYNRDDTTADLSHGRPPKSSSEMIPTEDRKYVKVRRMSNDIR
jgi:hypothetical protein